MGEDRTVCVGLDTHKAKIAIAVAEPHRLGEVRFQGDIANQPDAVQRMVGRLSERRDSASATKPGPAAMACTGRSRPLATIARSAGSPIPAS